MKIQAVPTEEIVKQYARSKRLSVNIPDSIMKKYNIKKGDKYSVGFYETNNTVAIVFEFNRGEIVG